MNKKERVEFILQKLGELYPNPPIPLNHKDPYTLLIAVLLSAQCTDERVNKVTPALFKLADTPRKMAKQDVEKIKDIIKPCGLSPQKSKAIKRLSEILVEEYKGQVPADMEALEKLPGVGHKTASVVMAQAFGEAAEQHPGDLGLVRVLHAVVVHRVTGVRCIGTAAERREAVTDLDLIAALGPLPVVPWLVHLGVDQGAQRALVKLKDFASFFLGQVAAKVADHLPGKVVQQIRLLVVRDIVEIHEAPDDIVLQPLFADSACAVASRRRCASRSRLFSSSTATAIGEASVMAFWRPMIRCRSTASLKRNALRISSMTSCVHSTFIST